MEIGGNEISLKIIIILREISFPPIITVTVDCTEVLKTCLFWSLVAQIPTVFLSDSMRHYFRETGKLQGVKLRVTVGGKILK